MVRKLKTVAWVLRGGHSGPVDEGSLGSLGTKTNLFHQGVAKEVDDPDVIAATMRKPGVILKRPIGSDGPFKEHAELPTHLPGDEAKRKPGKRPAKVKEQRPRKIDIKPARKAALAFEKEQRQRESERQKEEAAFAKQRKRRDKAVAKAQSAIEEARQDHNKRASKIEAQRAA